MPTQISIWIWPEAAGQPGSALADLELLLQDRKELMMYILIFVKEY